MNHIPFCSLSAVSTCEWVPPDLVQRSGSDVSVSDYEPLMARDQHFTALSNPLAALAILHYYDNCKRTPLNASAASVASWPMGCVSRWTSFGEKIMSVKNMSVSDNLNPFGVRSSKVMQFNSDGGVSESEFRNAILNGLIQFLPAAIAQDKASHEHYAHLFDSSEHKSERLLDVPPCAFELDCERKIPIGHIDLFLSAELPSASGSCLLPVVVVEVAVEPKLDAKHLQGFHYSTGVIRGSTDCPVVHVTVVSNKIKASLLLGLVHGKYTTIDLITDELTAVSLNCLLHLIAFYCRFLPALYMQRQGKVTSSMTFKPGTYTADFDLA